MDYSKLLFALEIRKLALDMAFAAHPEKISAAGVPDDFPDFVRQALAEALSTAAFIEKALPR